VELNKYIDISEGLAKKIDASPEVDRSSHVNLGLGLMERIAAKKKAEAAVVTEDVKQLRPAFSVMG
jgi:hypothetical protein